MKSRPFTPPAERASALLTVVMLTAMMAILTASMLKYTLAEKRGNERNRLALRAKNMAENISIYAAEQLTTKLYRTRATTAMAFMTGSNAISLPDSSGNNNVLSSVQYADTSGMEVRAGLMTPTDYAVVTDTTSSNYGLQVSTATVPIIAKATTTSPQLGSLTAYVLQEMEIAMTPLFQFGMFYNMDLELFPGQNMTIMGPVHTNGRLIARGEVGGSAVLTFSDRVSAAQGLYADGQLKVPYRNRSGGNTSGAGGSGAVNYTAVSGTASNLYNGGVWKDHKYGTSSETATTITNFKNFTSSTYSTNVRTNAHGVTKLELPGIGSYSETNLTTTSEDDRNNGRQLIEPPNPTKFDGTSWVATTDDANAKETKISWKAGLYIVANPDDTTRSATLPDGNAHSILPHSYRCWLNSINSSNVHVLSEIILPGQPTYGYSNNGTPLDATDDYNYRNYLPNRYTTGTAVGSNQVLRIPQEPFTRGEDYLINRGGGYVVGDTTLDVDTGTGSILAGEAIAIGTFKYLVVSPLSAGTLKIAAPGLRTAVADNTAVTVNPYGLVGTGSGYLINNAANYAVGATTLVIDNGTGSILPGNSVTIAGFQYLVTSTATATPHTEVTIAPPGLRAIANNNATVGLNATSGTMGTGIGYLINSAGGYGIGATSLILDSGAGTILPGDTLAIGADRYLVASALTGNVVTVVPALTAAVADDSLVIVDPLPWTGYSHVATTVPTFPAETSATPYPGAEAYFFDIRRANGNAGYTANVAGGSARGTTNYVPRPIAKIDFDMARFKMMVNRSVYLATTSNGYKVQAPDAGSWTNSIFNAAGVTVDLDLGSDDLAVAGSAYTVFPPAAGGDLLERTRPDPFRMYYAPSAPGDAATIAAVIDDPRDYIVPASALYDGTTPDAWFDGLAVYLDSVHAERRAQTSGVPARVDSGVRLINGRGPVATLTATAKTGFTFATNDAAYIIGHFNANGTVNTTTTATGNGGYSARYPDSSDERLCSVMADAIALLSQPEFSNASAPYYQTHGWNDALSAFRITNSTWTSTWRSAAPSSSNNYEGLGTSATAIRPGALPTNSTPGTGGTTWQTKLPPPADTEYSVALLVGIVPSAHNATGLTDGAPYSGANNQYSGGAHNFPRMLEDWHCDLDSSITGNAKLVIRGSMVALFESRVAMEPWNIRSYAAPDRYWGLHENFRTANHDVPLEPIVLSCNRRRYMEYTASEYSTMKTTIEALPY